MHEEIGERDDPLARDPLVEIKAVPWLIWVAARALGVVASPGGVFASFMVSRLFRTIGIMPGGLGTFEASSVMTLKSIGLPLPVGISATLLFRGLSFWLPMIPGLICARRLLGKRH
jgi:Mg2+-importing ATPase